MENYKQKYEAALETARKINNGEGVAAPKDWSIPEVIFPELRKSENERIKTNIIKLLRFVRDTHHQYFDECNEAIEWLEKQNKPQVRTGNEWVNIIDNACNHRYVEEYAHGEYCHEQSFKWGFQEGVDWLEKYPIFNMPKIEFKVGDWVIYKDGIPKSVYQVEKIENYAYTLRHILGGSMPLSLYSQNLLRLWTIQDAKAGDILINTNVKYPFIFKQVKPSNIKTDIKNPLTVLAYCGIGGAGFTKSTGCGDTANCTYYPATREQRDFLFAKMKEAGYKWDSNKKELIKQ